MSSVYAMRREVRKGQLSPNVYAVSKNGEAASETPSETRKNIDKRLSTRILCKFPRKGRIAFLTMLSNFRGRAEAINKSACR